CHAGVRPGVPLHKQSERDLMWIQSPFSTSRRYHGTMVVHGHSIVPAICIQPNRIGVDTGAYLNGTLTGLLLQGEQAWSLTVRAEE
ncbi:serine/threonine protein phosphatase, partial [Acinetobacter baumannii]